MDRTWLAQTVEEAVEPGLDIVDPHHHLWETVTRYGRYRLDDLLLDTGAGHAVSQTVFIDCGSGYRTDGPPHLKPLGETEYVAAAAEMSRAGSGAEIAAVVSHADLSLGPAVQEVLAAHVDLGRGRFRGVRHSAARAGDDAVPTSRTEPPPGLYLDPDFQSGAASLASMGLVFEAWQYHHQLTEVATLARSLPELSIVVNHLGGPIGVGRYAERRDEVLSVLRRGLGQLARYDNVTVKLGGVGMTRFGPPWVSDERPPSSDMVVGHWGELIVWVIDTFGPDRCMFESNYPVDGETVGYVVLWNAFKKISARYDPGERADLLAGTARRVYGLPSVPAPAAT